MPNYIPSEPAVVVLLGSPQPAAGVRQLDAVAAQAADAPAAQVTTPAGPAGSAPPLPASTPITASAVVCFLVALVVAVKLFDTKAGPTFTPTEGVGAFALFYVIAQASERLVELVAPLLDRNVTKKSVKKAALATAVQTAKTTKTDGNANAAAAAQAEVDKSRASMAKLSFGLTAALGMMACGYLDADFLSALGVDFHGSIRSEWFRLGVTGLVVGGGSAKLHDLIGNLSKSSAKKDDPKETGGK